jgi:predicted transposase/invertase (TIGR01784 family)
MGRLIRFDWAMKKLLRNKANFDILEGFLSELLKEDIKIQKILESESNRENELDKSNRVDLLVENSKGELVIIEVQNDREYDYMQRILYGTSKVVAENMYKGMSYGEIKKVISVSIVYFDLGQGTDYVYHGTTNFVGIHFKDVLQLSQTQIELYGQKEVYQLFPEYYLIKVNNFDEVAKDTLDEWIYFFKTEEIKPTFRAKGLQKAKQELDIMKLPENEQKAYKRYLEDLSYQASMFQSTYVVGLMEGRKEGRKEGIKEGKEEGRKEGKEAVALNAIQLGLSEETIVQITGLSIEEIRELKIKLQSK